MGVVAATMAARTKATGPEKATWMLIISSLLIVEVLAIRKERQFNEVAERGRVEEQRQQFSAIGDGIKNTIEQSQKQFIETMSRADKEIGLSQANLDHLTGGKTYLLVTPIPVPIDGLNKLKLLMSIVGKNPLYDLNMRLTKLPIPATQSLTNFVKDPPSPVYMAASASSTMGLILPTTIEPAMEGVSDYLISTAARNGDSEEYLHIRRNGIATKHGNDVILAWEFSFELYRNGKLLKKVPFSKTTFLNGTIVQQHQ